MSKYRAGQNVDAWCTKCKLVLAHTIEAVFEDKIKRVWCNTCGGKHSYKSNEKVSAQKKSKSESTGSKLKSKAKDFERLLINKNLNDSKSYSLKEKFIKGDLIEHKKFGTGVVVDERGPSKIEVLFKTGAKVLAHNHS